AASVNRSRRRPWRTRSPPRRLPTARPSRHHPTAEDLHHVAADRERAAVAVTPAGEGGGGDEHTLRNVQARAQDRVEPQVGLVVAAGPSHVVAVESEHALEEGQKRTELVLEADRQVTTDERGAAVPQAGAPRPEADAHEEAALERDGGAHLERGQA